MCYTISACLHLFLDSQLILKYLYSLSIEVSIYCSHSMVIYLSKHQFCHHLSLLCQLLEFNMFFCNLESFYSASVLISLPVIQLHTLYLLNNHTYRISRCYWYAHNASRCASSFTSVRTKWLVMRFFLLSEGINLLNLILC